MDEIKVWKNFRQGSETDYSLIYRKYAPLMFRYGCKFSPDRELIKDCLQQVFLNLWKTRERIGNPISVRNYLLKAMRNEVFKSFGMKDKYDSMPEEYAGEVIESYEAHLIEIHSAEATRHKIMDLLIKLSDRQREVIFLRYYNNLSYEEISAIMGIDHKSVYKLTYKAIEKLQQLLLALDGILLLLLLQ